MSHQEDTTRLAASASCCLRPTRSPYVCGRIHVELHVVAIHVSSGELPAERMLADMDPSIPDYHCGEQYCISAAHATAATWQPNESRRCVQCEADCVVTSTWPYGISGCQTTLLHWQIEQPGNFFLVQLTDHPSLIPAWVEIPVVAHDTIVAVLPPIESIYGGVVDEDKPLRCVQIGSLSHRAIEGGMRRRRLSQMDQPQYLLL